MSDVRNRPTIKVTREDVLHGIPGDAKHCPIANAVANAFDWQVDVSVNGDEVALRWYGTYPATGMTLVYATATGPVLVEQFDARGQKLLDDDSGFTFPLTIALEEFPDD